MQARAQASAALLLVASAVDKASSFDKEYEVTKGLAQALHGAYARALGLLAQIQVCCWLQHAPHPLFRQDAIGVGMVLARITSAHSYMARL